MKRISITFSADAVAWLEQEAHKRATSLADLVRRTVDEARGDYIVKLPHNQSEDTVSTNSHAVLSYPDMLG
jgi:hypothetical protein